ncbi:hypothetical protein [Streptomyces sp. NPDC051572]|uniref:hypothetical protein n=1 Tax=Streptomyces sp. NPDC051572 TaxID=3155802 RepID=UPI00344D54F8
MTLDDEISGAFSLIGLVLVFLFAYFSALWTQVDALIGKPKRNIPSGTLREWRRALVSKRRFLLALAFLIVLQFLLLGPLSLRVRGRIHWGAPFSTIRAGLLLVEALISLLLLFVVYIYYKAAADMVAIDVELARPKAAMAPREERAKVCFAQFVFPAGEWPKRNKAAP